MVKKTELILILFVMLLSVQIVGAVPPVQSNTLNVDNTFAIKYPSQQILKVNDSHNFEFHVFNSSTGMPIITGIDCTIHLYNSTGKHVYDAIDNTPSHTYDYSFNINASNFSQIGAMGYILQCNSSTNGGYVDIPLEITYNGTELTTARSIFNIGFIALLVFLFLINVAGITMLPSGNDSDDYGQLLSINNLKYFRGTLFITAWALLIAIVFTASNLSFAYLGTDMFGRLFLALFKIFAWLTIPFIFIWLLWLLVNIFKDRELRNLLERGIDVGGNI